MPKHRWRELGPYGIGFLIGSLAILGLHKHAALLTAAFLIGSFLLLRYKSQKNDLVFYTIAAALSLHEAFIVNAGAWQYATPAFFGLPFWLPLMYGTVAIALRRIAHLFP